VVELSALPSPRTALRSATADAVIVARQAFAQPVIAHGLDPDRVALIDASRTASDKQLGVSYRSVYGRAEAAAAARLDALARPA
jgi:hypothetical protein